MSVTVKDVHYIADLARLRFSPEEEEKLAEQMNRILDYMEQLNELDTKDVEPLARRFAQQLLYSRNFKIAHR